MSQIFSMDNLFFRIMTKVFYAFALSLLWLLCCIPVVTIGAANAAMNSVMLRMVRDEDGYIFKSYMTAFRKNFKQATAVWLIILIGGLIVGGDIYFFSRMGNPLAWVLAAVFIAALAVLLLFSMVVFHYLVWFDNPLKVTILNSFRTALGFLPYSVALLILCAAMFYGIYTSVPLMIVFTFFGAGLFSYISAYLWRRIFDRLAEQSIRQEENEK